MCAGKGARAQPSPSPFTVKLVRAYPRETQEMVFDAHEQAFAFFRGACSRGIYDNMKTAVETIFIGKDRQYNRRFLQIRSHHLVEPVACTPASGQRRSPSERCWLRRGRIGEPSRVIVMRLGWAGMS